MNSAGPPDAASTSTSGRSVIASHNDTLASGGCLRVVILVGVLLGSVWLVMSWPRAVDYRLHDNGAVLILVVVLSLASLAIAWSRLRQQQRYQLELDELKQHNERERQSLRTSVEEMKRQSDRIESELREKTEAIQARLCQVEGKAADAEQSLHKLQVAQREHPSGPGSDPIQAKPSKNVGGGKQPGSRKVSHSRCPWKQAAIVQRRRRVKR